MNNAIEPVVTILTAVVGVAILAVLVSRNSNTSGVLTAAGNAFGGALKVAVSPVTSGGSVAYGFQDGSLVGNLGG